MKKLILAITIAGLTAGAHAGPANDKPACPGKDKACCAEKAASCCPANKGNCPGQSQAAKKATQSPKAESNKS